MAYLHGTYYNIFFGKNQELLQKYVSESVQKTQNYALCMKEEI